VTWGCGNTPVQKKAESGVQASRIFDKRDEKKKGAKAAKPLCGKKLFLGKMLGRRRY